MDCDTYWSLIQAYRRYIILMEELKPPSSFPKTKVTPQLSRIQSAWCCLQQTFSVHTNDGKSSTKSDGDEIFAPPDDFREPRSSLNRSTYSLTSLPINFRSRFTKPVSLQKGRNSYFPDMNSMYKRVGVRFDHQHHLVWEGSLSPSRQLISK